MPSENDTLKIKVVSATTPPKSNKLVKLSDCVWSDSKGGKHINYDATSDYIIQATNCIYYCGTLYTPDGAVTSAWLRKEITRTLVKAGWTDKLDLPTSSILNTVKDKVSQDDFKADTTLIPLINGDLRISNRGMVFYQGTKNHVPYRLNVGFVDGATDMPYFNKWLHDVFEDDDIITVQEMLGYCLIPTTKAQEAFIIVGEAGIGKSILTHLLSEIFGNAYQEIDLNDLASSKFTLPMVENRLVVYDDDLRTEALSETGTFKKLVTASQPIKAERKFEQPYNFLPYCTIIANSNDMIKTLYDDSDGFYRRLHPIRVKPKDHDRKDIPDMAELVANEKEAILLWALKGLTRVIENNYKIHWSSRSKEYMFEEKQKGIHFQDFFDDVLEQAPQYAISSKELQLIYKTWATENGVKEVSDRRLINWLTNNAETLKIKKAKVGEKRLSGYKGVRIKSEWESYL